MTKVTDAAVRKAGQAVFLCDFSPPRGVDLAYVESVRDMDADFVCVAYNPGKSVRVTPAVAAAVIRDHTRKDVVFNLACRDMNKLALQSYLLGAQALGLENVVVVQGDAFTEKERTIIKGVDDITPTDLIKAVKLMNQGVDFKGLRLRTQTDFCVGAVLDLGRGVEREATLAKRKVDAGADFFITQSLYDPRLAREFLEAYRSIAGGKLAAPVFYGIQILRKDGLTFGDIPSSMQDELDQGRPSVDIALDLLSGFAAHGLTHFYLVPSVLKGGVRDYQTAHQVMRAFRQECRKARPVR